MKYILNEKVNKLIDRKKYKEAVEALIKEEVCNILKVHNYYSDNKISEKNLDYKTFMFKYVGNYLDFTSIEEMDRLQSNCSSLRLIITKKTKIEEENEKEFTYYDLLENLIEQRQLLQIILMTYDI